MAIRRGRHRFGFLLIYDFVITTGCGLVDGKVPPLDYQLNYEVMYAL